MAAVSRQINNYECLTQFSSSNASTLVENRTDFLGVVGRVPSLPLPDDAIDITRGGKDGDRYPSINFDIRCLMDRTERGPSGVTGPAELIVDVEGDGWINAFELGWAQFKVVLVLVFLREEREGGGGRLCVGRCNADESRGYRMWEGDDGAECRW
jgi:hypothetical protein